MLVLWFVDMFYTPHAVYNHGSSTSIDVLKLKAAELSPKDGILHWMHNKAELYTATGTLEGYWIILGADQVVLVPNRTTDL